MIFQEGEYTPKSPEQIMWDKLSAHFGHHVVIARYGEGPSNMAFECEDCSEVILDQERYCGDCGCDMSTGEAHGTACPYSLPTITALPPINTVFTDVTAPPQASDFFSDGTKKLQFGTYKVEGKVEGAALEDSDQVPNMKFVGAEQVNGPGGFLRCTNCDPKVQYANLRMLYKHYVKKHPWLMEPESSGECDKCDTKLTDDFCRQEGLCWKHCEAPAEHRDMYERQLAAESIARELNQERAEKIRLVGKKKKQTINLDDACPHCNYTYKVHIMSTKAIPDVLANCPNYGLEQEGAW